ncbi:uncharacterized protein L969DRAFT_84741 [Mixia osmundae IAM 14324]|uniref:uncharacterized protein n=1 Tax=Mixia osmundae (strain CBS 9802 / IAM 14324 / JCM 22182 / KY 12970) TaxID=764103 RepID=UPI0004A548B8|nr:uncharacterized protein L969DRAFT_84741 [Mixia osmundae IAM 14324]KEI42854.1 hypothetical protein L969DRAFT_84741 [Mixia osmundae IAM 14324]
MAASPNQPQTTYSLVLPDRFEQQGVKLLFEYESPRGVLPKKIEHYVNGQKMTFEVCKPGVCHRLFDHRKSRTRCARYGHITPHQRSRIQLLQFRGLLPMKLPPDWPAVLELLPDPLRGMQPGQGYNWPDRMLTPTMPVQGAEETEIDPELTEDVPVPPLAPFIMAATAHSAAMQQHQTQLQQQQQQQQQQHHQLHEFNESEYKSEYLGEVPTDPALSLSVPGPSGALLDTPEKSKVKDEGPLSTDEMQVIEALSQLSRG